MFKPAPGKAGLELVPDLADGPRQVLRRRQDLDLHDPAGPEVRGRHADHDQGHRVRRLAHLRPRRAQAGPELLRRPAELAGGLQGPVQEPEERRHLLGDRDARRLHDRLPPQAAVRASSTTSRSCPQTAPGAGGQGHRREVHQRTRSPRVRTCGTTTPTSAPVARCVRNPNWDASTDPNRKALPDQIDVKLGLQADDLDNQIISGDQDVDIAGTGVQPAAMPKVLQTEGARRPASDNPVAARAAVHPDHPDREAARQHRVPQGDHVRDEPDVLPERLRRQVRRRRASPRTMLPPTIPGYKEFDLYGQKDNPNGQLDKAKEALKKCGQPDGFETNIGYRSDASARRRRPPRRSSSRWARSASRSTSSRCPTTTTPPSLLRQAVVRRGRTTSASASTAGVPTGTPVTASSPQIVDSRVINPEGGSSNFSVRIPEVDKLLDQLARRAGRGQARRRSPPQIDKRVMEDAVHLPGHLRQGRAAARART